MNSTTTAQSSNSPSQTTTSFYGKQVWVKAAPFTTKPCIQNGGRVTTGWRPAFVFIEGKDSDGQITGYGIRFLKGNCRPCENLMGELIFEYTDEIVALMVDEGFEIKEISTESMIALLDEGEFIIVD
jgi:hypothetical protein